jgi:hypothetical protein
LERVWISSSTQITFCKWVKNCWRDEVEAVEKVQLLKKERPES